MIFRPRKHAHNLTVDLFDKTKHTLMKMWRLMKRGPDFPWIPFCYFCTKSTWICNGKWDDVTQIFFPLTATHYICHLFLHQFFTLHFPLSFHIPPISTLISPHLFLSSIVSLSVCLPLSCCMRFCGYPQRYNCTHILWWQCAGDNEVSGKRGLGGVVGIISAV